MCIPNHENLPRPGTVGVMVLKEKQCTLNASYDSPKCMWLFDAFEGNVWGHHLDALRRHPEGFRG